MSRTIRRKNWNYSNDRWVTHDHKYIWRDLGNGYQGREYAWIPKSEKEVKKEIALRRSDAGYTTCSGCGRGPGKWFRQNEQQTYRTQARNELVKYQKDPNYEVMILANPKLPYWD